MTFLAIFWEHAGMEINSDELCNIVLDNMLFTRAAIMVITTVPRLDYLFNVWWLGKQQQRCL